MRILAALLACALAGLPSLAAQPNVFNLDQSPELGEKWEPEPVRAHCASDAAAGNHPTIRCILNLAGAAIWEFLAEEEVTQNQVCPEPTNRFWLPIGCCEGIGSL